MLEDEGLRVTAGRRGAGMPKVTCCAAQVFVVNGKVHVVRSRQPVEDIWKNEVALPADAA